MSGSEHIDRQLEAARAEVRLLTEQLAIAERVHQKLRGRIASLERALEERGTPLPPQPLDADEHPPAPAVAPPPDAADPGGYGFGEHEDDLLPQADPGEHHHRWRRPH